MPRSCPAPFRRAVVAAMGLLFPSGLVCLCCGNPSDGMLMCPDCQQEAGALLRLHTDGNTGFAWQYDGCIRTMILQMKDHCQEDCVPVLASGIAECIRQMTLPAGTVLTWVTMPEKRRQQRGIDHGRLLCEAVSGLTGLPARQVFTRVGRFNIQRSLSARERLHNLDRTFICQHTQQPILLIDDVMTTGSTVTACRNAALRAGTPWAGHVTAARVL